MVRCPPALRPFQAVIHRSEPGFIDTEKKLHLKVHQLKLHYRIFRGREELEEVRQRFGRRLNLVSIQWPADAWLLVRVENAHVQGWTTYSQLLKI